MGTLTIPFLKNQGAARGTLFFSMFLSDQSGALRKAALHITVKLLLPVLHSIFLPL